MDDSHDDPEFDDGDAIDTLLEAYLGEDTWNQCATGMRSLHRDRMLDALIALSIFADDKKDHHAARTIDRWTKAHCKRYGIIRQHVAGLGWLRCYQKDDDWSLRPLSKETRSASKG